MSGGKFQSVGVELLFFERDSFRFDFGWVFTVRPFAQKLPVVIEPLQVKPPASTEFLQFCCALRAHDQHVVVLPRSNDQFEFDQVESYPYFGSWRIPVVLLLSLVKAFSVVGFATRLAASQTTIQGAFLCWKSLSSPFSGLCRREYLQ